MFFWEIFFLQNSDFTRLSHHSCSALRKLTTLNIQILLKGLFLRLQVLHFTFSDKVQGGSMMSQLSAFLHHDHHHHHHFCLWLFLRPPSVSLLSLLYRSPCWPFSIKGIWFLIWDSFGFLSKAGFLPSHELCARGRRLW